MEFEFRSVNNAGKKNNGVRSAENSVSLARDLRQEGWFLVWSQEKGAASNAASAQAKLGGLASKLVSSLDFLFKRISLEEKMIFARHLGLMIKAGFSLNKALETLTRQTKNKHFAVVLKDINDKVSSGQSFHQSVSQHADVFSPIFISMVKVGEASGKLEETLKLATLHLKREHTLKSKIKGAMTYPIVILCALTLVGAIMVIFVLPQLASTFSELNVPLPLTTRIIFGFVNFASRFWYLLIMIIASVFWGLYFFIRKTDKGKNLINLMFLRVPIFSALTKKLNSARFSRTLGSLLAGGVSLTEAIKITADSLTNIYYRRAVLATLTEVEKGQTLSSLLTKSPDLFPPVVTEMIAVGEETGSLTLILKELARFFESEVAVATKGLSSIVEPVIMIVIGVVVGIFALSIIQPIYSITNSL